MLESGPFLSGGSEIANAFRGAMRRSAASAHLITTSTSSGETAGMTATAVCSLSLSPPSLLVCINQESRTHSILRASQRFCVNIVHAKDRELCESFGQSSSFEKRFISGDWQLNDEGMPLLQTALANIICAVDGQLDYSTHTVFIGRVQEVMLRDGAAPPLIYHNGAYGKFAAFID